MEKIITNPFVLIGVASALVAIGVWVGGVNEHKQAVFDFMRETRTDIKALLARLPAAPTASGSPMRLTDLGVSISQALDAAAWAGRTANDLLERIKDKEPYEVQELCFSFVQDEFRPTEGLQAAIKRSAYENGLKEDQVLDVLVVELRDALLALKEVD